MPLETTLWDTADYLKTKEDVVAYLEAAFENGDEALIVVALGNVARCEVLPEIADAMDISHTGLQEALSGEGRPKLVTVLKVMQALGLKLTVVAPAADSEAA